MGIETFYIRKLKEFKSEKDDFVVFYAKDEVSEFVMLKGKEHYYAIDISDNPFRVMYIEKAEFEGIEQGNHYNIEYITDECLRDLWINTFESDIEEKTKECGGI